jgi:hypothetical protein
LKESEEIPGNLIPNTVAMIAERERMKAIKKGKYEDAIGLSLIEVFALEAKKKRS